MSHKENELSIVSNMLPQIEEQLAKITKHHNHVSEVATPPTYVKKKQSMDYVEISYMKMMADLYFPGWSWEIINTEVLGTEAYVVHGRLTYYDSGIKRVGDMTAAHRIQRSRDKDTFVDIGNDVKSANTDCMKKAFNMYMNIADDVYRNQIIDLKEEDIVLVKEKMIEAGFDDNEINRIQVNAKKGKITKLDLDNLLKWIKEGPNKNKEQK
tara:strand:+ start:1477 stop:2109 length:633 start_codon:yes stop_codon:yes gene_type:complete